jgi:hypothetical protein
VTLWLALAALALLAAACVARARRRTAGRERRELLRELRRREDA